MTDQRVPATLVLSLLFLAIFLTFTVFGMLGPLLVELAAEFQTSVAVAGQLAAATSIAWAIAAPLVGPWSDTYGRRLVVLTGLMLMALGVLGSVLAWSYGSMLGFRLLTGLGMAAIAPSCLAIAADIFPPEQRGKAVGWLISATGVGAALGIPGVVLLADAGGWQLPFYVIGALLLVLWVLLWVWLPHSQQGYRYFFSIQRGWLERTCLVRIGGEYPDCGGVLRSVHLLGSLSNRDLLHERQSDRATTNPSRPRGNFGQRPRGKSIWADSPASCGHRFSVIWRACSCSGVHYQSISVGNGGPSLWSRGFPGDVVAGYICAADRVGWPISRHGPGIVRFQQSSR
jgi:hypothetical protein